MQKKHKILIFLFLFKIIAGFILSITAIKMFIHGRHLLDNLINKNLSEDQIIFISMILCLNFSIIIIAISISLGCIIGKQSLSKVAPRIKKYKPSPKP